MSKKYDLAIIGMGTAAMVAAMRVKTAGWSVAVTAWTGQVPADSFTRDW
ncbi:hypothetical protein [Cribrihabitans pelagius]